MGYWLIANNDVDDLKVNSWHWGAIVPVVKESNTLESGVEVFDESERFISAGASGCLRLADWLEDHLLTAMPAGTRLKLDGTITAEPDDGEFHREDLSENYSVSRSWLLEFVTFLKCCGGFHTLG